MGSSAEKTSTSDLAVLDGLVLEDLPWLDLRWGRAERLGVKELENLMLSALESGRPDNPETNSNAVEDTAATVPVEGALLDPKRIGSEYADDLRRDDETQDRPHPGLGAPLLSHVDELLKDSVGEIREFCLCC